MMLLRKPWKWLAVPPVVLSTGTDLAKLEAHTIWRLDEKLLVGLEIEHYKMHELALDNRLKHLDIMCFPILFPSGRYCMVNSILGMQISLLVNK